MMHTNNTPRPSGSPRRNDPSTWRNSYFSVFVVQALPRDKHALELDGLPTNQAPEVFRRSRCRWYETDTRSYGLQDAVPLADGTTKAAQALRAGDELGGPSGRPQRATAVHITRHVQKGEAEAEAEALGKLVRGDGLHVHLVELPERDDSKKEPIEEERVELAVDVHRCAGTTKDARSWVRLDRRDALHAIYAHYLHANLSICRFRSGASGDYAADLVFEIDAHAEIPTHCELEFFHPYIGAAVSVGRRIYDHLISRLEVDPKYITASISRMGARVTVDWRAFGPRRLHEILLVIRWVESQVFAAGDLAEIAKQFGIPKVEIDAKAYGRSDAPRPTLDGDNTFIGPWLRPVGALHSKSSNATWWYRTTPVPHDRFTVENTAWLTAVSRGSHPNKIGLKLGHNHFLTWPEARHPRADRLIEANPRPSRPLIDLFERDDLLEQLGDDYRAEVTQAKQRACGTRIRRVGSARDVDEETIKGFVALLGVQAHEHTDKWQIDCPRSTCKAGGLKAAIYKDAGTFTCFRCSPKGLSLWNLASELGLSSQLPTRAQSSSPVQWVPKGEAPTARPDIWAGPYIEVHEPECATIEEVWAERERLVKQFQGRDDARVLIDVSATGLGKSEAARRFLGGLSSNYRVLAPRDDIKSEYQVALPMAVTVDGRRLGVNCVNEELDEVTSRGEPVGQTLCATCPSRKGCEYFAQLKVAKDRPTILSHAHGPFTDLDVFDNDATIDVVDEDALDSVILSHDLDEEELGWFKARLEYLHADDGEEDVSLDTPISTVKRVAASERIGVLVDRLAELLTTDSITSFDAKLAANQEIADLQFGRLLFRDVQLREAIEAIDDTDLDAHDAARLDLLDLWRERNRPLGVAVPREIETTWKAPPGSPEQQTLAWLEWSETRLQVVEAPDLTRDERRLLRRPKAVLRQLVEALRNLYVSSLRGVNEVSPLQAYRPEKSGPWVLRLNVRRTFLESSSKVIFLSATTTPERVQLLMEAPSVSSRWIVFRPKLPRKDLRVMIADKSYSKTALLSKEGTALRERLFETTKKLIEKERTRTGLPVALLGPSPLMNLFLAEMLGKKEAAQHKMPFTTDRVAKVAALKLATEPLGFICGYAYGVAGSNEFFVMEGGVKRFVRSVIILGNPIPNLREFARAHRGLFTDFVRYENDNDGFGIGPRVIGERVIPDWRETFRAVPFAGQDKDDKILVAKNVIGFGDDAANSILAGRYEAEILQMAGRSRPFLDDPIDPTIQPRVYVFAGVAIPNWDVDEVIGLEELREKVGLDAEKAKTRGGSKSSKTLTEQIQSRVTKRGVAQTITWLAKGFLKMGKSPGVIPTLVRHEFERAGCPFRVAGQSPIQAVIDAVNETMANAA